MPLEQLGRPATAPASIASGPLVAPMVLSIEDDLDLQGLLAEHLARHGYQVELANSAAEASDALRHVTPQLILLDLGLPDLDGIELCRNLAVWPGAPIIVVSADALDDRIVEALDAGACDYVTKPFRSGVLMARVRAALRGGPPARGSSSGLLTVGDVALDPSAHQLFVADERVDLHARGFATLEHLVRNVGALVPYAALVGRRRGEEVPLRELKALRVVISRLRKVLGTGPHRPLLVTEPHVGYRLEAPP